MAAPRWHRPVKVKLAPDGTALPAPAVVEANPDTWLAFTDLVFVDPVGTGFSRSALEKERTKEAFFGVQQDVEAIAEFIRLFLTRMDRWLSPKFLVGESYGTTRTAYLAEHLQQRYGLELNGIVLVSPVLDFATVRFHPSNELPYVLSLPTYSATAWHHGRLHNSLLEKPLEKLLEEVETFAMNEYTVFLGRGDSAGETEKRCIFEKVSGYTSLSQEIVERAKGRVKWNRFSQDLLRDQDLMVGRMDTTVTGRQVNPASPYPEYDPSLDRLFGTFSSAMNAYVRETLRFQSDAFYEFLNRKVGREWNWKAWIHIPVRRRR